MQAKTISASPATTPVDLSVFKPLRLNFAQVCMYCGTRWCESTRCAERHAASVWVPCLECDGFGSLADCAEGCINGVVEMTGRDISSQASRVLPDNPPGWGECTVAEADRL